MENNIQKLTKKELAQRLYKTKIKLGEPLIPIGAKKRMSEEEFVRRYLNGVGGTTGFKKHELIQLNETYDKRLKKALKNDKKK